MGTPAFAVPILDKIREKHEVILVVTQPDVYNIKKKKLSDNFTGTLSSSLYNAKYKMSRIF